MGDDRYKKIFAKNLKKYMNLNRKSQIDLINDLGLNKSAVSTWCNGTRLPRMDKVDLLAKYFNINRSDLIEERGNLSDSYYLNDETLQIAQEIFENPELYSLFRVARDLPSALLKAHIALMELSNSQISS